MKIEEQQEKAIEQLRNWKAESISAFCTHDTISVKEFNKSIDIVLNLIKSQQAELEKKDKMIDMMANFIDDVDKDDKICSIIGEEVCNTFENGILNCIKCIKQYFERRAEQ